MFDKVKRLLGLSQPSADALGEPSKPALPPSASPVAPEQAPRTETVTAPAKKDILPSTPQKHAASFETAFLYTLQNEGGYSDVKEDHGGPTKYGITQADYARFKGRPVTANEVKAMTQAEAQDIYRAHYWSTQLEKLDQGVATAIFDWSVLHGTNAAILLAKGVARDLGGKKLTMSGIMSPADVDAINALRPTAFIAAYAQAIKKHFLEIVSKDPSQKKFLAGWENRADRMAALS